MFTLRKKFTFEASHRLPLHDGKCSRLHGHSWVGWLEVYGEELYSGGPKSGMLVDFGDLKRIIEEMVNTHLDHYHLNESLEMESPTSEAIAQFCYRCLFAPCAKLGVRIRSITIEETCTSACIYSES